MMKIEIRDRVFHGSYEEVHFSIMVDAIISQGVTAFQDAMMTMTGSPYAGVVSNVIAYIRPKLQSLNLDINKLNLTDQWPGTGLIFQAPDSINQEWFRLLRWIINNQQKR
jgi:hypothetical protein